MKKIIFFLILVLLEISGYSQVADNIAGKYIVTEIRRDAYHEEIHLIDTTSYYTDIIKLSDSIIAISFFAGLDTIKATIIKDSIYIFPQTLYYEEWDQYYIQGYGKLFGDTLKYHYTSGGPLGLFEGDCVAVKESSSSKQLKVETKEYRYYPNPFESNICIDIEVPYKTTNVFINIYSCDGKLVKRISVKNRGKFSQILELSELHQGNYILELNYDYKNRSLVKIIKAR